jgi:hypothetical protein
MSEYNEGLVTIADEQNSMMDLSYDNILAVADRADKMVTALNKIMAAAIKITTPRDWCIIGGSPYLQESGATKVARLFGIGWQILDQRAEYDPEGYPTYTYRMAFTMGGARIECDGSRSARDDFFAGARVDRNGNPRKQKSPDEVDIRDVKQAAYTNCLNNGIKRILNGLRNLDFSALEESGLNVSKIGGYTFREGSRGGNGGKAEDSGVACESCGEAITQKVASYSQGKYGRKLCMKCQKSAAAETAPRDFSDAEAPPERRR